MKIGSYKILFRIFSFLSDKTNGAQIFVKYKLLLGTLLVGLTTTSAKAADRVLADTVTCEKAIPQITCYKATVVREEPTEMTVVGMVVDETGEALIGCSLVTKNSKVRTLADGNGRFGLIAKPDDILIVTHLGMESQEVLISKMLETGSKIVMRENQVIMCYDIIIVPIDYKDDIYKAVPKEVTKMAYSEMSTPPVSPVGNLDDFQKWVQNNIQYDDEKQAKTKIGDVILSFAIDKEGKLVDEKVIGKLAKDARVEVLRVLAIHNVWKPGMYNDKPTKSTMTISINLDNR